MARKIDAQNATPARAGRLIGAWLARMEAHAALVTSVDGTLREAHGISAAQFEILARILHGPAQGTRMQDLAEDLYVGRSSATRLVDGLEGEGLIARVTFPADRRGTLARLTDAGRTKFLEAAQTFLDVTEERFRRLGTWADVAALEKALTAIAE